MKKVAPKRKAPVLEMRAAALRAVYRWRLVHAPDLGADAVTALIDEVEMAIIEEGKRCATLVRQAILSGSDRDFAWGEKLTNVIKPKRFKTR